MYIHTYVYVHMQTQALQVSNSGFWRVSGESSREDPQQLSYVDVDVNERSKQSWCQVGNAKPMSISPASEADVE